MTPGFDGEAMLRGDEPNRRLGRQRCLAGASVRHRFRRASSLGSGVLLRAAVRPRRLVPIPTACRADRTRGSRARLCLPRTPANPSLWYCPNCIEFVLTWYGTLLAGDSVGPARKGLFVPQSTLTQWARRASLRRGARLRRASSRKNSTH